MFKIYVLDTVILSLIGIIYSISVMEETTTEPQIILACVAEKWAECEEILEKRISKDSVEFKQLQDIKNNLPLVAAYFRYTELLQLLLNSGVEINKKYGIFNRTLLHYAAGWGRSDNLVTLLLTQGADINVKDKYGYTPLHRATFLDQEDSAKLLIDSGAQVNISKNYGESPLHSAVLNNSTKIFELLVKHGADINVGDNRGHTPLHRAVMFNNVDIVRYLVNNGCNKTKVNVFGFKALDIAKFKGFTEIVKILSKE